ncbi:periplasmic heavy metal sensor [Caulobacter sp. CCH9-E1]|uniref:periplasmic heavy metal sensor n=1 Tax=Caulobacter sp. CCH9-E1 TaxID=1768768 RepID=UPI00082ADFB7|nr:periplasmic heavy metal sensor [Caulobacter sp. CCH9-E1]
MNGSRPWMIALAVSAAINVFLIGGLAGMAFVRLTAPPPASAPAAPAPAAAPRPAPDGVQPPASSAPTPAVETPKPPPHAATPPARSAPAVSAPAAPPPQAAPSAAGPRPPLISAGEALSPESRQAFRKALSEANRRNRPITQQARAERQAALNALSAPDYDPAEVSRRLATARDLDQQARANVEAALAAFTATLSPQERAALAAGLTEVYTPLAARRAMRESN